MSERMAEHDTFIIERTYKASPRRVFAAWSDPQAKAEWFSTAIEFDFRVGGREFSRTPINGTVYTFDATYHDIVPDRRIVYTYIMDRDQTRISASLVTIEFESEGENTKLTCTEQGVYLDGEDQPQIRLGGTKDLLDKLGQTFKDE